MNPLDARRRLLGRNVYKKTVEGNPAIAQGSLARRYPGIGMQGWTEQAQYEGNQLFDVEAAKNPDNYIEGSYGYWGMEIPAKSGNKYTFNRNLTNGYGLELGSAGLKNDNQGSATFLVDSAHENLNVSVNSITAAQDKIYFVTNQRDPEKLKQLIETCFENPMLNEGSTALPWEPYTGAAPSPSPDYKQDVKNAGKYNEETQKYEYEVKLTGKNLFDTRRIRNLNSGGNAPDEYHINGNEIVARKSGGTANQMALEIGLSLKPGTYYFAYDSMEITNQNGETYSINSFITSSIRETASGDVVVRISLTTPGNYTKVTIENDIDMYLSLSAIHEWESISELKIYGLRIVLNADTPFEPYKEQTVILTSDRPLTKWDKLEKRNGVWGWVYKSDYFALTGVEEFVLHSTTDSYNKFVLYNIPENIIENFGGGKGYCNMLLYDANTLSNEENGTYRIYASLSIRWLAISFDKSYTLDTFKEFLQEKNEEGNPFIFWYETGVETFVPLSESEQEQMNALYTFRPTTVLSNDCECNMTLTYKTKKSLEVTT